MSIFSRKLVAVSLHETLNATPYQFIQMSSSLLRTPERNGNPRRSGGRNVGLICWKCPRAVPANKEPGFHFFFVLLRCSLVAFNRFHIDEQPGALSFSIENGQRASVTTFQDAKAVQTVGSGVLFTVRNASLATSTFCLMGAFLKQMNDI